METFWTNIQNNFGYTNLEIRRIQYTLKCIGTDLSKIIMMFFIFLLFGKQWEYLIGICVLCSLRIYSGGIHMKRYWSCFAASFMIMLLSVAILPLFSLTDTLARILTGICCIITYLIGAIPSFKRPQYSYSSRKNFRLKATGISFAYFLLTLLFPDYKYLDVIVCTIVVQTVQLSITNYIQKGEERYEKVSKQ